MSDKSFLGMTVEGAGGVGREQSHRVPQLSREEFEAALQAVLRHKLVTGVAWTQYTPYWNDGEPCTFRVGEVSFAFAAESTDKDEQYFDYGWQEDDFEETGRVWCSNWSNSDYFDRVVGKDDKDWGPWKSNSPRDFTWKKDSGPENAPDPQLFTDVHEFIRLMDGGFFENVVEDLFGDHAIIRMDKLSNKVIIDEYSHD